MWQDIKYFLFIFFVGLIFYFGIICPIQRWNCNRVGMDFTPFISGCIVRQK